MRTFLGEERFCLDSRKAHYQTRMRIVKSEQRPT